MATTSGTAFCRLLIFLLFSSVFSQSQTEVDKCDGIINNCFCSDTTIDCNGAELSDIADLYGFISPTVSVVSITGGNINKIQGRLFGIQMNHLVKLNLSGNSIETLDDEAFQLTPNLKMLDLSGNQLILGRIPGDTVVPKAVDGLLKLEKLHLRKAFSTVSNHVYDGTAISNANYRRRMKMSLPSVELLDISGNLFTGVSPAFQSFLCNVSVPLRHLNMSNNLYGELFVTECLTNLVDLDYSNNRLKLLTAVDSDVIESLVNLQDMRLGGNTFDCDCRFEDTLSWLGSTDQPLDFKDIVCNTSTSHLNVIGEPIRGMNLTDLCGEPRIIICYGPPVVSVGRRTFFIILACGIALVVAVISIIVLMYRRRRGRRSPGTHRHQAMISQSEDEVKAPPYSRMV